MSIATDIASREDLLALLAELDAREAIEVAAAEPPADHVRAIPVRALVKDAPALPAVEPLPVPRPHGRSITGPVVKRLIEAGTTAAIVNGPQGVEVLDHFDADDASIVVLADYWEVAPLVLVDKQRPTDVASDLLRREQRAWDKAAA